MGLLGSVHVQEQGGQAVILDLGLIPPRAGLPVLQPEDLRGVVGFVMLDDGRHHHNPLADREMGVGMAVAGGALEQAALDLGVCGVLAEFYGGKELRVGGFPVGNGGARFPVEISKLLVGKPFHLKQIPKLVKVDQGVKVARPSAWLWVLLALGHDAVTLDRGFRVGPTSI